MKSLPMAVLVCLSACLFEASAEEGVWLNFQISFQSQSPPVLSDSFRAVVSERTGVVAGLDRFDVRKPPANPGGDSIRAATRDAGSDLAIDFRPGNAASVDAVFPVEVVLTTDKPEGLTGKLKVELTNPSALTPLGTDIRIYAQCFDKEGRFLKKFDFRADPSGGEWDFSGPAGKAALLRLIVVRECIAVNINRADSVNLADLALLAGQWNKSDFIGPEDINGDASVNLTDLTMLAEAWLQRCPQ